MENLKVGQEVIGKFHFGRGKDLTPMLAHPHGHITEITEKGFKVDFPAIKGGWTYKFSDIGKIVYLKEEDTRKQDEQLDYQMEKERLGMED